MSDLNTVIQEFLHSRTARGIKPTTIRGEKGVLRAFLTANGNILVRNIDGSHIDRYLSRNSHLSAGSWNRNRGYLQGFFAWCRSRKYLPRDYDPLEGIGKRPVSPRDFIFIPVDRFDELLTSAKNGRDRALLALGIYTLQRMSTIGQFTWANLNTTSPNPQEWSLASRSPKTETIDSLPVSLELKEELDRWRFEYGRIMGQTPEPHWKIVPPYHRGRYTNDASTGKLVLVEEPKLNPTGQITRGQDIVKHALGVMGYQVTNYEGAHTLRRSGGKALYEELAWNRGHDGAIRIVQSMFGHKSLQTTEHYLRLTLERKLRNDTLSGSIMFTSRTAKVVNIGTQDSHSVRMRQSQM